MLASISSEGHWHPFFQQGSTHHLGRHLRPSPQWALAAISSAGALASISSARQCPSPEQAPEAISLAGTDNYFLSRHRHPSPPRAVVTIYSAGTGIHLLSRAQAPSPQHGTGCQLLSKTQALISSGRAASLWCQALPNLSGDRRGCLPGHPAAALR